MDFYFLSLYTLLNHTNMRAPSLHYQLRSDVFISRSIWIFDAMVAFGSEAVVENTEKMHFREILGIIQNDVPRCQKKFYINATSFFAISCPNEQREKRTIA